MPKQINEIDFNGQNIYVGLDVHKKSWKVTIMLEDITHKTFSQDPDAKILGDYLRKNFPGGNYYSAYEAGCFGFSIHRDLQREGINNIVVNPADIPTTDKEVRQKEDKRDSRKLSRSLKNKEIEGIHVPKRETEELRTLLKCRADNVKDLNRLKNRIKSLLCYYGIAIPKDLEISSRSFSMKYVSWLKTIKLETRAGQTAFENLIGRAAYLKSNLASLTRAIREEIKQGPLSETVKLLRSIPGIGLITASYIIAVLEDIGRFRSNDELCSFIGLVPSTNSSGERDIAGNVTPRAQKKLRGLIVESAWTAARRDPALLLAYQKLCGRMAPSKAIIRIAKKLVNRARYVLKNKVEYTYAVAA